MGAGLCPPLPVQRQLFSGLVRAWRSTTRLPFTDLEQRLLAATTTNKVLYRFLWYPSFLLMLLAGLCLPLPVQRQLFSGLVRAWRTAARLPFTDLEQRLLATATANKVQFLSYGILLFYLCHGLLASVRPSPSSVSCSAGWCVPGAQLRHGSPSPT
jgi:hypothetical protein